MPAAAFATNQATILMALLCICLSTLAIQCGESGKSTAFVFEEPTIVFLRLGKKSKKSQPVIPAYSDERKASWGQPESTSREFNPAVPGQNRSSIVMESSARTTVPGPNSRASIPH